MYAAAASTLAKQMHFVAVVPVKHTTLKLDWVNADTLETDKYISKVKYSLKGSNSLSI